MTLKIGWLHEAENDLGTWLHEADDWHLTQGPALERMVLLRVRQAREAQRLANLAELEQAS